MISYEGKIQIAGSEFFDWVSENYGPDIERVNEKLDVLYGDISWNNEQELLIIPFAASDDIPPRDWNPPASFMIKDVKEPIQPVTPQELSKNCSDEIDADEKLDFDKWAEILNELNTHGYTIMRDVDLDDLIE